MIAIVVRQAEHMTRLIDDLLDVSRINKGLVTLDCEALDLRDVLANAVEQVRSLMEKQSHDFSMQVTGKALRVEGDRVRLVQVFADLLTNAAKYTLAGGKISLDLSITGSHARVGVRDNGVGLHGGTVTARSDGPGLGSEFVVCIPLLVDQPVTAAPPLPPPCAASNLHVLHIMVVDDNISVAYSAEQALTIAMARSLSPPQAFLLDNGQPGMDGYELARRLRSLPAKSGATLIALTGYGQQQDREKSSAAGFDYHLEKPVDTIELLALLNRVHAV